LVFGVGRLVFEVWPRAAAQRILEAHPDSHRACGGLNFKHQTPNTKRQRKASPFALPGFARSVSLNGWCFSSQLSPDTTDFS
jgi:hypothetical protein